MIGLGLRQLQEALNRKADGIQREFVRLSDRLQQIGQKLLEVRGDERERLRAEQEALRARQQQIADEVNLWRDRARAVLGQRGIDALRAYIQELVALDDPEFKSAAQHALYMLDAPEEELAALAEQANVKPEAKTPAARLLERARTEYDLRGVDSAPRHRAAIEFANRSGMAQDLEAIAEIERHLGDPDPLVREVVVLTVIQLHRFRAMRLADLDVSHRSVQRLAQINHQAVVPVLVEILEKPRTGFVNTDQGPVEADNGRSRMVALLRLVEWHTAEAQAALRARLFDLDPAIVKAANKALELFPGDWSGPLKMTGSLPPAATQH
ncbi:MAG: OmpH family outer membrane protein [Chloroflexota bacterium]